MNRITGWTWVLMMAIFVLACSCAGETGGACSDATPTGTCSTTKPMFCAGIDLIKKCGQCGCPNGMTCQTNGDCKATSTDCSDGTKDGQCSSTKPSYCSAGTLINKCSQCGCPSGNSADCQGSGTCLGQQVCSDSTPYGQCSSTKPSYCSSGTLMDKCSQCGCPSGNSADCQGSGSCQAQQTCTDGTAYGQCSTTKPSYCSSGTLINKCSECGCPSGNSADCQGSGSCQAQPQNCNDGTLHGQCSTDKPLRCNDGNLNKDCQVCGCDSPPANGTMGCDGNNDCKLSCSNGYYPCVDTCYDNWKESTCNTCPTIPNLTTTDIVTRPSEPFVKPALYTVVPIYFVPKDWSVDDAEVQNEAKAFYSAISRARQYYADMLNDGGKTFRISSLYVVQAQNFKESYGITHNGNSIYVDGVQINDANFYPVINQELYNRGYPIYPAQDQDGYIVVMIVKGAGGWAGGLAYPSHQGGWGILADWCVDSLEGDLCVDQYSWWSGQRKQYGAVAHELGHAFTLSHPATNPDPCDNVMYCWWDYPYVGFISTDIAQIKSSRSQFLF